MSFNSKYSGQQVENLLDQVANGNTGGSGGGGGITTETDPIFSASPAAKITDENISSWNNKVDKVDGKQLSTEDFTTVLMNKLSGLNNYDDTAINQAVQSLQTQLDTLVSGNASTAIDSFNEIIAFLNGITDSQSLDSIIASIEQQIAGKMDKVTLAAVATSGNYNDLSNKPTIPSAVTESTVSGWGFTKNTGTYSKPSTGIPKTDLASAVQTSLGKADTALQSEQYKGTVTSVKINGATKTPDTNGMVDLGTIESGGGSSSGGSGGYAEVNHGTDDNTFTLTPNTFHIWDEVASLDLSFADETAGVANEYLFQFTSGATATTLTLPEDIKWTEELVIEANRIYQVSILKGLASVLNWKVEQSIAFPITLEMGDNGDIGISLYSYLQSTYGEPTSGTTLNEEIINNYNGVTFETIEYATYMGFTGYWLNGYKPYIISWVLLEDGYLQRVLPAQEN